MSDGPMGGGGQDYDGRGYGGNNDKNDKFKGGDAYNVSDRTKATEQQKKDYDSERKESRQEQNEWEKNYVEQEAKVRSYGSLAEYNDSETHQRAVAEFDKRSAKNLGEWNKLEGGTKLGDVIEDVGDTVDKISNPWDTYYNAKNNVEDEDEIKDYFNNMFSETTYDDWKEASGLHAVAKGVGATARFAGDVIGGISSINRTGSPIGLSKTVYDRLEGSFGEVEGLSDAEKQLASYDFDYQDVIDNGGVYAGVESFSPSAYSYSDPKEKEYTNEAYRGSSDKDNRNVEQQSYISDYTTGIDKEVVASNDITTEEIMLGVYDENDTFKRSANTMAQVDSKGLDSFSNYSYNEINL
jgi:hypothetical protein